MPAKPTQKKRPLLLRIFFRLVVGLIVFALVSHYFLNAAWFQKWALNRVNQIVGVDITWDRMSFTGITGHFSGDNLRVVIPRAHAGIELKSFKLSFNPWKILLRKLHLFNLEAENLSLTVEAPPSYEFMGPPHPSDPIDWEAYQAAQRRITDDLSRLLELFSMDRARISRIEIKLPKNYLSLDELDLNSTLGILFYARRLELSAKNFRHVSDKFDTFATELNLAGQLQLDQDEAGFLQPDIDMTLQGHEWLLGFNKVPIPWNESPNHEVALEPVLKKYYGDLIPENRSFAMIDRVYLPFSYNHRRIGLENGTINAFKGRLHILLAWDFAAKRIEWDLNTIKPIAIPYLPLGKSNIRTAFQSLNLKTWGRGGVSHDLEGRASGQLNLELTGSKGNPEIGPLKLFAPLRFKDGTLELKPLQVHLDTGRIEGSGTVNVLGKAVEAQLTATNLDLATMLRLFTDMPIAGRANAHGEIQGKLNNPSFAFKLDSPAFSYQSLHFADFAGELKLKNSKLYLEGRALQDGTGSIDLKINDVFTSMKRETKLLVEASGLNASKLLATDRLHGTVSAKVRLYKQRERLEGDGRIEATQLSWFSVPIQSVRGEFEIQHKKFIIRDRQIVWGSHAPAAHLKSPFTFIYYPNGYEFSGDVLPTITMRGQFLKDQPTDLRLNFIARPTNFIFLKDLIPFEVSTLSAAGTMDYLYKLKDPGQSSFQLRLDRLDLQGDEKSLALRQASQIDYTQGHLNFKNTRFNLGQGDLNVQGRLGPSDSNLLIKGNLDLLQLTGFISWLAEGIGIASADLELTGPWNQPQFQGSLHFQNNTLVIPALAVELSEITGILNLDGRRLTMNQLNLLYDDAPIVLNGMVGLGPDNQLAEANLQMKGTEIQLSQPEQWNMAANAELSLTGSAPHLRLSGRLDVVEGLYYKDYSLSQFILKPVGVLSRSPQRRTTFVDQFDLDLLIKSLGEFEIRNNLAEMALKGELRLRGRLEEPGLSGTIDIIDGEIHAFGIDFESASGFASFDRARGIYPLIEFTALHEIQNYEIKAKLIGYADNLNLLLESIPALQRNEIISLIAYGRTPDQLTEARQSLFSNAAIASQVVGLLQRPLSKATSLDIVKLEQQYDPTEPTFSRFSIGKQLSDRFALAFTTDLSLDEAYKGFVLEYSIIDNLLIKGTKDTGSRYRFDLTWRLQTD